MIGQWPNLALPVIHYATLNKPSQVSMDATSNYEDNNLQSVDDQDEEEDWKDVFATTATTRTRTRITTTNANANVFIDESFVLKTQNFDPDSTQLKKSHGQHLCDQQGQMH